jgi:hypothetical protein
MSIDVRFIDARRTAREPANPKYPNGMMVNLNVNPLARSCSFNLPYPAPRCGQYIVTCRTCGFSVGLTVAGRADDPRVITIPCRSNA